MLSCPAVHFWAPTFKWGISIANIADMARPAEKVSTPQQCGKAVGVTQSSNSSSSSSSSSPSAAVLSVSCWGGLLQVQPMTCCITEQWMCEATAICGYPSVWHGLQGMTCLCGSCMTCCCCLCSCSCDGDRPHLDALQHTNHTHQLQPYDSECLHGMHRHVPAVQKVHVSLLCWCCGRGALLLNHLQQPWAACDCVHETSKCMHCTLALYIKGVLAAFAAHQHILQVIPRAAS
jgi:hypothetical protein